MTREEAFQILNQCGISKGTDFSALNSGNVSALLIEAARLGYRQRGSATASRGHCFYNHVMRAASRKASS